jgi:hypothetical protein
LPEAEQGSVDANRRLRGDRLRNLLAQGMRHLMPDDDGELVIA